MLQTLPSAGSALEVAARDLDPTACSGSDAVKLMEQLGVQRRLIDGMLARLAKRVEDTAEHTRHRDRSAAELCARVTGVSSGEAKRAIEVVSDVGPRRTGWWRATSRSHRKSVARSRR